jgi:hypothetical protein
MNKASLRLIALLPGLILSLPLCASDPRLELYDGSDGANCKYFNAAAAIPWRHPLGDWRDADGQAQGDKPFAASSIRAGGAGRAVEWDVTDLVRGWLEGSYPNSGLLLATLPGPRSAPVAFVSREAATDAVRPRLTLNLAGEAQPKDLAPKADVWLDCSTAYALGTKGELRVGDSTRSALQFDLGALAGHKVERATLVLTTLGMQAFGSAIGIFRVDPPISTTMAASHTGIASAYPRDAGIGKNPDVLFATGFESSSWRSEWSYMSEGSHADRIDRDDRLRFKPLVGHALRVEIAQGDNFGLDLGFDFKDKLGYEPEEIYFRYYIRFADDWNPTVDGGKLPGLSATYGKAGWGGRRADPSIGWSMRGQFNRAPSPANPLHGHIAVGTYAYHAGMEDEFGDHWYWMNDGLGVLERNRWYCLEQYFKVNAIGAKDGVLRAWIDGALAFEKTDIWVRDLSSIKIERVWMNVYHGGTAVTDRPLHLYFDNVVVAKKPIGCTSG